MQFDIVITKVTKKIYNYTETNANMKQSKIAYMFYIISQFF